MKTILAMGGVIALGAGSAMGALPASLTIDLSGLTSNGFFGNPTNVHVFAAVGAGSVVTSIDWDVSLTFASPSWAEEASISADGVDAGAFSNLQYFPGVSSGPPIAGSGTFDIADYTMIGDTLDIELHEQFFDDIVGGADAFYGTGSSLTVNYKIIPAPGALALLGVAGLAGRRRRR